MNDSLLDINNFELESSADVEKVLKQIKLIESENMLIHIVSFIHNTVLVQTLHKKLNEKYKTANIVLLTHKDKTKSFVTVFNVAKVTNIETISDEVLKELYLEIENKKINLQMYRNKLFQRYFTDHLTNLPNLYQLRKDLQNDDDLGLILIQLDNFQIINNFYGFIVGDYVIEEVGNKFKTLFEDNKIYKLSGAEFAMTLSSSLGFYELKTYLESMFEKIRTTQVIYKDITISIEFTLSSTANHGMHDIFSKVSMALKYAKDKGLPFWIYEDRMNFENEYERNLKLSEIVRKAVQESRILPYFQPIVNNRTNKIEKYECLARLIDENQKIVSPVIFIPIAKNIKVYNDITKIIIEKSFDTFENNNFEFNINLSSEDMINSKIFHFIIEKLKTSKAANRVTFELLESEAVKDFKKVERFINEVKRYGAKIAIDDFGSGFSNFSYLLKMKTDYIKIDGSLIKNIDVDKQSLLVVETIVDFAKKLDVKTVAEYVHSSVVMDKVQELKIDYSQGFYIDEPSLHIEKA